MNYCINYQNVVKVIETTKLTKEIATVIMEDMIEDCQSVAEDKCSMCICLNYKLNAISEFLESDALKNTDVFSKVENYYVELQELKDKMCGGGLEALYGD